MSREHREDRQRPDHGCAPGRCPLRESIEGAEVARGRALALVQRVEGCEHTPVAPARAARQARRRRDQCCLGMARRVLDSQPMAAGLEPAGQLDQEFLGPVGVGGRAATRVQLTACPAGLVVRLGVHDDREVAAGGAAREAYRNQGRSAVPRDDDRLDEGVALPAHELGAHAPGLLGPVNVDSQELQHREQGVVGAGLHRAVMGAPADLDSLGAGEGAQLTPRAVADSAHAVPSTGSVCRSRLSPAIGIPTQSGRWSSS